MPLTTNPLNDVTDGIIAAAIRVHKELGPGLVESAYESCLTFELVSSGFDVERQRPFALSYRGNLLEKAFRIDLLVNRQVVVEVKAVERLLNVHQAQVLSYLKLTSCRIGLLLNFHVTWLMDGGFRRLVLDLPEQLGSTRECLRDPPRPPR